MKQGNIIKPPISNSTVQNPSRCKTFVTKCIKTMKFGIVKELKRKKKALKIGEKILIGALFKLSKG